MCCWQVKLVYIFGDDKTKSNIFGSKRKLNKVREWDIRRGNIKIKQQS